MELLWVDCGRSVFKMKNHENTYWIKFLPYGSMDAELNYMMITRTQVTSLPRKLTCVISLTWLHGNSPPSRAFIICRGLSACMEMLWMGVLYVSFGSKVIPRTFGCIAMVSALLFILSSRWLVYFAGSGVSRVQVVLSGFSVRLLCFVQAKYYVDMVVCISWLHLCWCM